MDIINKKVEPGTTVDRLPQYMMEHRAYVVSNIDRKRFLRVKMFIPDLMVGEPNEENCIWARPRNNTFGGRNFIPSLTNQYSFQGSAYIPVLGTWWYVEFENGDPNRCFYTRPCDIEHMIAPPECLLGDEWYHKWLIGRTPEHRSIILSDDPKDRRSEMTGFKRNGGGTSVAGAEHIKEHTSEHVLRINNNQKVILIDDRSENEKILIADQNGNYINVWSKENHIHVHSMADTKVYAEKKLWLESMEECHVKCQKNIYMHAEFKEDSEAENYDETTAGNIHIRADKNIYIEAGEQIHMISTDDMFVTSLKDMHTISQEKMKIEALKEMDIRTSETLEVFSNDYTHIKSNNEIRINSVLDMHIKCEENLNVESDLDTNINAGAKIKMESQNTMDIIANQDMYIETEKNLHIRSTENMKLAAQKEMHQHSVENMKLTSLKNLELVANEDGYFTAHNVLNLLGVALVAIDNNPIIGMGEASPGTYATQAEWSTSGGEALPAEEAQEADVALPPTLAEPVEMKGDRNEEDKWKNEYDKISVYDPTPGDYKKLNGDDAIKKHMIEMEKGQPT